MKVESNNFGQLIVRRDQREYYLTADGDLAVRWYEPHALRGHTWHTMHCRVFRTRLRPLGERIKAMLLLGIER